mgnify:CR=1 FL=1
METFFKLEKKYRIYGEIGNFMDIFYGNFNVPIESMGTL